MARVRRGHNWWATDPTAQARGYRFQFALTKRIMEKLSGFKSIAFKDMNGNLVTKENYARPGRDGGTDLVIEITTKGRAAGMQTAGKVKKKLKDLGRPETQADGLDE